MWKKINVVMSGLLVLIMLGYNIKHFFSHGEGEMMLVTLACVYVFGDQFKKELDTL